MLGSVLAAAVVALSMAHDWGNEELQGGAALVEIVAQCAEDGDADELCDDVEAELGTDSSSWDSDGDGMPDGWEIRNGLEPTDPADGAGDPDGDLLDNLAEYEWDSLPYENDTDADGFWDGLEAERGADPSSAASYPASSLRGDVNCDGVIDAVDVQMVLNGVLGVPVPAPVNVDYVAALDASDVQYVINAVCRR